MQAFLQKKFRQKDLFFVKFHNIKVNVCSMNSGSSGAVVCGGYGALCQSFIPGGPVQSFNRFIMLFESLALQSFSIMSLKSMPIAIRRF